MILLASIKDGQEILMMQTAPFEGLSRLKIDYTKQWTWKNIAIWIKFFGNKKTIKISLIYCTFFILEKNRVDLGA